jgi:hypothetical protein
MATTRAGMGFVLIVALLEMASVASATSPLPIVDGPAVLQRSPAEIQMSFGQPVRTKAVPAGDFRLPEGGIWRVYRGAGTRLDIDFERERSTTVMIAFPDRATAPRSYEEALAAVNLPSGPPPDLVMRDSREWSNLRGYFVRVIAAYPELDRIDAIILSVAPFPAVGGTRAR